MGHILGERIYRDLKYEWFWKRGAYEFEEQIDKDYFIYNSRDYTASFSRFLDIWFNNS